jgi:methylated-DNA-[protein]-cysteine S-methyltransferase
MTLYSSTLTTPLGSLTYLYDIKKKVYATYFDVQKKEIGIYLQKHIPELEVRKVTKGVYDSTFNAYFLGGNTKIHSLPIVLFGTELQISVWNVVGKIQNGSILRYKDAALQTGNEKAVRAVASAIGANPVCLIIPCHRVIASDGGLAGYAGGVQKKKWLLEHEGVLK